MICSSSGCSAPTHGNTTVCAEHLKVLLMKDIQNRKATATETRMRLRMPERSTVTDFRFSASYASRYHNCHGSANLELALPGFIHPERNDNGMKGEGTRLHKIFQDILESDADLRECAAMLDKFADVYGPQRTKLIQDKREYLMWWVGTSKKIEAAPVPHEILAGLIGTIPVGDAGDTKQVSTAPRRIKFLAEALIYMANLLDEVSNPIVKTEEKIEASWLVTKPKTTSDVIVLSDGRLDVIDLKMGDIEVSPILNEQLMYYGQTYRQPDHMLIRVHILQRNNLDYWDIPLPVLDEWAAAVQESERAIQAGSITLSPGDHCKFCPANPHGRGDRGNKSCPAMLQLLYGERDRVMLEETILEGYDDE